MVLAITDTGSGMSDEVVAKAFEPFFTTKEVGKGSGLGLAQVFGFAKQSGGGVSIETCEGQGTTVRSSCRASRPMPARRRPSCTCPPSRRWRGRGAPSCWWTTTTMCAR